MQKSNYYVKVQIKMVILRNSHRDSFNCVYNPESLSRDLGGLGVETCGNGKELGSSTSEGLGTSDCLWSMIFVDVVNDWGYDTVT